MTDKKDSILEKFKKNLIKKSLFKKLNHIIGTFVNPEVYLLIEINQDEKNIFIISDNLKRQIKIDLNSLDLLQGYLKKSDKIIIDVFTRIHMENKTIDIKVTYNDYTTHTINF